MAVQEEKWESPTECSLMSWKKKKKRKLPSKMTSRTTQGLTQFLRNFWGKDLAPASPPRSDSTLERRMKIHVMITHFKICCKKDVCPRRMCLCSSGCLQCRHITGFKRYSINHFLIMGGSMVREKQWWDWMIFWGLKTVRIWQVRITMHLGLVGQLYECKH